MIGLIIELALLNSSFCFAQIKGGRWTFENNGDDVSTWDNVDNNGSLSGSALYSGKDSGIQGDYYLSLDDSADYGAFTVPDQEELDFENEGLAISVWVFPVEGYDNPQYLFIKGERSGVVKTNNYALRVNNQYLELIAHSETGANKVARSSFKVVLDEWNFTAVYYDYDNSKLYMWNSNESAPIDTLDFNAPLFPNDNKLYVGTAGENGFKRFWGRIDDIRISNRVSDIIDNTTSTGFTESKYMYRNFTLNQNYPNPFNPNTAISYKLQATSFITLKIYDVLGNEITTLVDEVKEPGEYKVEWNATNIASGVYYLRLKAGNYTAVKKMLLMK